MFEKKIKKIEKEIEDVISKVTNGCKDYFEKSNFDKKNYRKIVISNLEGEEVADWREYKELQIKLKLLKDLQKEVLEKIDVEIITGSFGSRLLEIYKKELIKSLGEIE